MIDHAKRDRRWCQGNLQHLRVLIARGLHPLSRIHMGMGVMSYVSSPLWLFFIGAGLLVSLEQALTPLRYFPDGESLFPVWPVPEMLLAVRLLGVSFAMLLAPKIFGWILLFFDRELARGFGGKLAALRSVLFETVLSVLTAPVMMLFHTSFVIQALSGVDTGWGTQSRDDRGTPWRDAARLHRWHTAFGLVLGLVSAWISWSLFLWLSPLTLGLVLSIPVSVLTSRASVGLAARHVGLLVTPEETDPPPVVTEAAAIEARLARVAPKIEDGLARVIRDPLANAIHIALLPGSGGPPADPAAARAAYAKLGLGDDGVVVTAGLSKAEKVALMFDPATLTDLHMRVLRAGAVSG
jgi:membrane glycosyltransferase